MSLSNTTTGRNAAKLLRNDAKVGKPGIGTEVFENNMGNAHETRPKQGVEIFTTTRKVVVL